MHESHGDPELFSSALKLAVVTHLAYDAPHKTPAREVLNLGRELLKEAGLSTQGFRSTFSCAWSLLSEGLPSYSRRPWETVELDKPEALRSYGVENVGLVWLPAQRIVLGKAAGQAAYAALQAASGQRHHAWRCSATTWPLLEIVMWLLHKAQERRPTEDVRAMVARAQAVLEHSRVGRPLTTLGALYRSLLF